MSGFKEGEKSPPKVVVREMLKDIDITFDKGNQDAKIEAEGDAGQAWKNSVNHVLFLCLFALYDVLFCFFINTITFIKRCTVTSK